MAKKSARSALGMVGGAAAGAAAGAMVGPVGAALGAVMGGIAGANANAISTSLPNSISGSPGATKKTADRRIGAKAVKGVKAAATKSPAKHGSVKKARGVKK